jgi:hypothetical protein
VFDHYHYVDALPDEQRYESIWVNYPGELGEHHRTAYSMIEDAPGAQESERSR